MLVACAVLSGLVMALVPAPADLAGATPRSTVLSSTVVRTPSQTTTTVVLGSPHIIPQPNAGRAPRDAGERGGWMQEALFGLLCAVLVLIGLLIWRDSRRKRRALAGSGQGQPASADR